MEMLVRVDKAKYFINGKFKAVKGHSEVSSVKVFNLFVNPVPKALSIPASYARRC